MIRLILPVVAGLLCMASSRPDPDTVPPFFKDDYESSKVLAEHYDRKFCEGIQITGTPDYITSMVAALELIESKDPRNWYFVRKHIRRITLNGHSGIDIGGGRLTSGNKAGEAVESVAGGIVHEAWHRELFLRGAPWTGREAEIFCLEKQNELLERLNGVPFDIEEVLASEYWKIDYRSRNW